MSPLSCLTKVGVGGGLLALSGWGLVLTSACSRQGTETPEKNATAVFVGDAGCANCHALIANTYRETAHARTSNLASGKTIHGPFSSGRNELRTANPDLYFLMEKNGDRFTQTAWARSSNGEPKGRAETFEVVVGSGRKGQTYLYWSGENLFQLPVSYWTELNCWVNSPGYADGTANFERPTPPRCLECHASSFESLAPPENHYRKSSLVLGISCEKCHGPGSEHVARYRAKSPPKNLGEAAIVNPARLGRAAQIDVCSLCHAGPGRALTPPLSFRPGDRLAEHLTFPTLDKEVAPDVHASQVQLMERSRCFRSGRMTCNTCHDVHQTQRTPEAFSARCLTCHQVENCGVFAQKAHAIDAQCVSCHMPLQKTQRIVSAVNGRALQPEVRSHLIAVYPHASSR